MVQRVRLKWIDALRGVLILLVVLGHCIQVALGRGCEDSPLYRIIYSFHMPAFFAVSGYLSYHHHHRDRWYVFHRRFLQLMVPFFIWSLIAIGVFWSNFWSRLKDVFVHPDIGIWFLWALFWVQAVFLVADWLSEKIRIKQVVGECLMAFVLIVVFVLTEFRILGYQFIAFYLLFFLVGYYYHKYRDSMPRNGWLLAFLTLVWGILAWFWHRHQLPSFLSWVPYPSIVLYAYRFLTAFLACYVLLSIGPACLNRSKKLAAFGKVSLGIYVIHVLFCARVVQLLASSFGQDHYWLTVAISFIVVSGVSFGISWLLSRNRYTARFLLGKLDM